MKPFKLMGIPLAVMALMLIYGEVAVSAPLPVPESEIVTAFGYKSQMPCTQPEMMLMMDQVNGGAKKLGTAPGDGSSHEAHHPGNGAGVPSESALSPANQLSRAIEQVSIAIQAFVHSPQTGEAPSSSAISQKGVTVRWTDHLEVVQ